MDPSVNLHPTVERPPFQTVLTFTSWRQSPRVPSRTSTPDSQRSPSHSDYTHSHGPDSVWNTPRGFREREHQRPPPSSRNTGERAYPPPWHSTPRKRRVRTSSNSSQRRCHTDSPKRFCSKRSDSRLRPKIRALSSIENSGLGNGHPRFRHQRRCTHIPQKYGALFEREAKRTTSQLHKDAWFHIMTFLTVPDICAFHGTCATVWRSCKLALGRVEDVRLARNRLALRAHILEAVLRGGCGNLKVLDVPGNIPIISKVVHAAHNIEKIQGLAPNLLSKHLDHSLPSLTSLSMWIDEKYSDDLSTISVHCRNLLSLRINATAGMTVYDQQAGLVLRRCTKLERLSFHGVRVTTDIAEEIQHLEHLHTLKLEDGGITDSEVITLIDNLKTTSLRSLSLKRNPLSPTGVAYIGRSDLLRETLLGLNICGSGDIYAGTYHMVCAPDFLPKMKKLRVASRLVHVFEKQMHKTRPNVEVCSRNLGSLRP